VTFSRVTCNGYYYCCPRCKIIGKKEKNPTLKSRYIVICVHLKMYLCSQRNNNNNNKHWLGGGLSTRLAETIIKECENTIEWQNTRTWENNWKLLECMRTLSIIYTLFVIITTTVIASNTPRIDTSNTAVNKSFPVGKCSCTHITVLDFLTHSVEYKYTYAYTNMRVQARCKVDNENIVVKTIVINTAIMWYDTALLYKSEAYLDLLLGGGRATQIFSSIQAHNLQVKFLVIFKSGEFLIICDFFFNLILDPLRIDFCAVLF
jgi:hypothetical protein